MQLYSPSEMNASSFALSAHTLIATEINPLPRNSGVSDSSSDENSPFSKCVYPRRQPPIGKILFWVSDSSHFYPCHHSSVGIVTRLRNGCLRNRGSVPGKGKRFPSLLFPSYSVHIFPGAHLVSYLIATWTSFFKVKKPERESDPRPQHVPRVERVQLCLQTPSLFMVRRGTLP
jgi:hypothetical protein